MSLRLHPTETPDTLLQIEDGNRISAAQFERLIEDWRQQVAGIEAPQIALTTHSAPNQLACLLACQATRKDLLLLRNPSSWSEQEAETRQVGAWFHDRAVSPTLYSASSGQGTGTVGLQTSGTTGTPKLVRHTIDQLLRKIPPTNTADTEERWLLTYHPSSYAGLQVILTAWVRNAVLISQTENTFSRLANGFIQGAATHVSGTPSFWRGLLLEREIQSAAAQLKQITLGGEAVDPSTLNRLQAQFPNARIIHIYASTEAGVGFSVRDGQAGFPAQWLATGIDGTDLKIESDELWIRTPGSPWLATGDWVAQEGERILFRGRHDGTINVGGTKVAPERVEACLLQHPSVGDIRVFAKKNPITGAIVAAEVIPSVDEEERTLIHSIQDFAAEHLPRPEIPRSIHIVRDIDINANGKKKRNL